MQPALQWGLCDSISEDSEHAACGRFGSFMRNRAQAPRLPGPGWVSLVDVTEVIFIVRCKRFWELYKADTKYIEYVAQQYIMPERQHAIGRGSAALGAFAPETEQEQTWKSNCQGSIPCSSLSSCVPWPCLFFFLSFPFLLSSPFPLPWFFLSNLYSQRGAVLITLRSRVTHSTNWASQALLLILQKGQFPQM